MFITKLLEKIFTNSLKDKQGPSFLFTYIISWLMVNIEYSLKFLSIDGNLAHKIKTFTVLESTNPTYLYPLVLAILIIFIKPWLNNFGLLAKEGADKATQKILEHFKIHSYRTEKEFKILMEQKEEVEKTIFTLRENMNKVFSENETLKVKIKDIENELANKNDHVDQLQTDVNNQNGEISTIKNKLTISENKIENLKRTIETEESTNAIYEDENSELKISNDKLELGIKVFSTNLANKEDELTAAEYLLNTLKAEKDKLTSKVSTLQKEIHDFISTPGNNQNTENIKNIIMATSVLPVKSSIDILIPFINFDEEVQNEDKKTILKDFFRDYDDAQALNDKRQESNLLNILINKPHKTSFEETFALAT